MNDRHITLGITGASGAIYGLRLGQELLRAGCRLSILISGPGFTVLKEECGLDWTGEEEMVTERLLRYFKVEAGQLSYHAEKDFFAPIASGSAAPDALVICPCSMGTLARIAAGFSGNLLERAADVMIKEGRQLLMVPRETPLSAIHLENMLKLSRLGVRLIPAMPGFYGAPQTVDDLVNFMVGKVLDILAIPHELSPRWERR
jgi:4-hydroxy-3-polyprenylbenzoate decarboxylase